MNLASLKPFRTKKKRKMSEVKTHEEAVTILIKYLKEYIHMDLQDDNFQVTEYELLDDIIRENFENNLYGHRDVVLEYLKANGWVNEVPPTKPFCANHDLRPCFAQGNYSITITGTMFRDKFGPNDGQIEEEKLAAEARKAAAAEKEMNDLSDRLSQFFRSEYLDQEKPVNIERPLLMKNAAEFIGKEVPSQQFTKFMEDHGWKYKKSHGVNKYRISLEELAVLTP